MKRLFSQVIATIFGLWLGVLFIPGVQVQLSPDSNFFGITLTAQWQVLMLLGAILGLLTYFAKPILDTISLPLRMITLGLFGLVINAFFIWMVDFFFKELVIPLWLPLLYVTLIISGLNFLFTKLFLRDQYY